MRGLCKVFEGPGGPVQALLDIGFEMHRREFLCVVGPSGCGKSTLVRALAGLETRCGGEILIEGWPARPRGADIVRSAGFRRTRDRLLSLIGAGGGTTDEDEAPLPVSPLLGTVDDGVE